LTKGKSASTFEWDFTHCPDIAQTISVICAVKGVKARLTGLESLRIKETDRIEAIKNELGKFGVEVKIEGDEAIELDGAQFNHDFKDIFINTYEDHRMAMAYAPLALLSPLEIEEPDVVKKSYPDYWRDLEDAGFTVK
jgi:3-phosphoshikimate 1-carboxyvinyltransferase